MHQRYFYIDPRDISGTEAVFRAKESRHMVSVLRMKQGDCVRAVDGAGTCYTVILNSVSPSQVRGTITQKSRGDGEPLTDICLAAGIVKGGRFEWLIEKATEMGVKKIIPFFGENSVVYGGANKVARWKRIALSATKQCLRTVVPEITGITPLHKVLMGGAGSVRIIAAQTDRSTAVRSLSHTVTGRKQSVLLVVGPEGGFTDAEVAEACEQGFSPVSLGTRRLRSETAAVALIALCLDLFE